MWRRRFLTPAWLVVPLVLLFWLMALDSLRGDSPTMDEQNHLARGLALLASGDPRFSLEHPPLINVMAALPVWRLLDVNLPFDHPSWNWREGWYAFADQLVWVANHDVERMFFLSRLVIVWMTLGMGLIAFRLGRSIWSAPDARGVAWSTSGPGLVAMALLLLDPNFLAHGHVVTTDLGGAATALLALWAFWRLWQLPAGTREGRGRLVVAGLALGLAFASKHSNLLFVPIFALLALLPGQGGRLRRLGQLLLAGLISLPLIWLAYGAEWGAFRFLSPSLAPLNRLAGPMPTYWAGLEQILAITGDGRTAYLLGRHSDAGFGAYFPVALAVKTPLAVLALALVAAAALLRSPASRRRAAFLLLPAAAYFVGAMQSDLNIGYRHILPVLGPLAVLSGGLVTAEAPGAPNARRALTGALILVLLLTSLRIHPHHLSYFNLIAGGPIGGARVLTDSNIDWGQDLKRLRAWQEAQGEPLLRLGYFGTADPEYYGIVSTALPGLPRHFELWWEPPFDPADPEPGLYAISVSNLTEPPLAPAEKTVYAWFRAREPDDRVGYSINLYRVP